MGELEEWGGRRRRAPGHLSAPLAGSDAEAFDPRRRPAHPRGPGAPPPASPSTATRRAPCCAPPYLSEPNVLRGQLP